MRIRNSLSCMAVALCIQMVAAASAQAATTIPAIAVEDDGFVNDGDGPWTLGWRFTAASGVQVDALGVFDADGDGLTAPHLVGLWDNLNTLIASVVVSTTDPLIDGFRYADISTIDLTAGATYTVGAADLGAGDGYYLESTFATPSFITFLGAAYGEGSGLVFPDGDTPVNGYFGANLLVSSAVPEPATWALMIAGFGLAGVALRSRRTEGVRA